MTREEMIAIIDAHFALPPEKRKGFPRPLPCLNLGDELRAGAIAGMGLDPRKRWRLCNAGKVAAVCVCNGGDPRCGPKCSGYETKVES